MRRNTNSNGKSLAAALTALAVLAVAVPAAEARTRMRRDKRAVRLEQRIERTDNAVDEAARLLTGYEDLSSEQELYEARARLGFSQWHVWNEAWRAARRTLDRVDHLAASVTRRATATRAVARETRTLLADLDKRLPDTRTRVRRADSKSATADLQRATGELRKARREKAEGDWYAARSAARRADKALEDADRQATAVLARRKAQRDRFQRAMSALDEQLERTRRAVRRASRRGDRMAARTLSRAEHQRQDAVRLAHGRRYHDATRTAVDARRTAEQAFDRARTARRHSRRGRRVVASIRF